MISQTSRAETAYIIHVSNNEWDALHRLEISEWQELKRK